MKSKMIILAVLSASATLMSHDLHASILSGVKSLQFQASTAIPTTSTAISFSNVRAISSKTTLNDYLIYNYTANITDQRLTPSSVTVYKNIGVYDETDRLFINNSPATITLTDTNGVTHYSDTQSFMSSSTGAKPLVFKNLAACSSLSFSFFAPTAPATPFELKLVCATNGQVITDSIIPSITGNNYQYMYSIPVLRSGEYNLYLIPIGATSVNYNLRFSSENASTLTPITTGQTISCNFRAYCRDYSKWSIGLQAGQSLSLSFPGGSSNVHYHIIRSDSTEFAQGAVFEGISVLDQTIPVQQTGTYYIVLEKDEADWLNTGRASCTVTVNN